MTKKRFTLHKDYGIHDHLKSVIHDIETTNGVLDIIQELNILHYGIEECNRYMHRTDAEIHGLKKENHMLKQQFNYIQNSISEHIKHQKTELGQKALQEIIADYNEWMLGHKEAKE